MNKLNKLLFMTLFLFSVIIIGQTKVTGSVIDETGEPLPGASIVEEGTSNGTTTDFDGKFSLTTKSTQGSLIISFVGYSNKQIGFNSSGSLGVVQLASDNTLEEVVVTAYSIAIDRKTPVAVSTIKAAEIERKLGNQEFPEVLKSTPGVYATRSGGGFGDGRINMRGFNSENVAVMINGVPVNDMENGRVFWSNWAGLGDVTSLMQTQRGLGASKVAVPSVGGTINIVTKSTDAQKGGSVIAATGNDGYQKYGFTLSTGKMESGLGATVSIAKISGDGFVDGTQFNGWNYFGNLAYEFNDKHTLSLTTFGAPQRHGQRQNRSLIERYRNSESGIRFNPDWGYKNGQIVHVEDNFYHKNQTSLNHYWNINDDTSLSTALYFSLGTGGGGGTAGDNTDLFNVRLGGDDQPIDLDNIVEINRANATTGIGSEAILRASRNDHNWYGMLTTFNTKISPKFDFLAGLDFRQYKGIHFREVTDLLGGNYYFDDSDENNLTNAAIVGDKITYYNDGIVGWGGLFVQMEYSDEKLDAFVSTTTSNTSYKRIDYFNYLDSDPLQETDKYDFVGYGAKGGVNYKLDQVHNVFANVGYFQKAPIFDAVFLNFSNDDINESAENEKIFSVELGYGIRTQKFSANLNAYRTEWNDKSDSRNVQDFTTNILGIDALHQGIEFDFVWKPTEALKLTGMASVGDWKWDNNIENAVIFDPEQEIYGVANARIEGLKVGDAAQTTAALGLLYKFWDNTSFTLDANYFGDLYADFDILDSSQLTAYDDESEEYSTFEEFLELTSAEFANQEENTWKVPNYVTFDASLRHGFDFGSFDTTITLRVNNILNTEYVSDALGSTGGTAMDAEVWYGAGRTFSLGAKIKF